MDFLEGFLLGPLWSDTEYETRRHIGFHLLLGAIVSLVFLWLILFPDKLAFWLSLPTPLYLVFFLLLFFAAPFAARLYYQMVLPLKLLVLLLQTIKIVIMYLIGYQVMLPKYEINIGSLPEDLMNQVNDSIASSTEFFNQFGKTSAMFLGIAGGGLMVVFRMLLIITVAVLVPVLMIYLLKLLQWSWDQIAQRFILREIHK